MCIRDSLGGVLLEVDQLKQLDLITLRGEDQFMLFAAHAQLKGDFIKGQIQDVYKRQSWLMAAGMAPCCSNQYFATAIRSGVSGHSFQFPKGR